MKKVLNFILVLFVGIFLLGCDELKQTISDTLAPEIEKAINALLEAKGELEKFELPEATRYENFTYRETETTTELGFDVIEPKVTYDEYISEIETKYEIEITDDQIQKLIEEGVLVVEGEKSTYTVNFDEIKNEDGTIQEWKIRLLVENNTN